MAHNTQTQSTETKLLHQILAKLEDHDKRFDSIEERLDGHDKRFDSIKERLDGHDKQFDSINKRFKKIEVRLDKIEANQQEIISMLNSVTDWTSTNRHRIEVMEDKFEAIKTALV